MNILRPPSPQPIPPHAKKVFQGKIFSVYQWEQKMFDGSIKIFEKIKRPDTVNVFPVTPEGKIILTQQEQPGREPFIGAAGGIIDSGEDPLSAAKRELLEETGYETEEFILWYAVQRQTKIDWVIYTFIAKKLKKVSDLKLDSGEKISLLEVTFDEFIRLTTQDNYRDGEIALKIFQLQNQPQKFSQLRQLFLG